MILKAIRLFVLTLAVAVPLTSQADPVRVEWTSAGTTSTLLSGSGYWVIDSSVITPNLNKNYTAQVSEFAFDWTTTSGSFSSASALGNLVAFAVVNFSPTFDINGFDICVSTDGVCAARTSHPLIRVSSSLWGATRGLNQSDFARVPQSASRAVASVPLPGTLPLLGLGLICIRLRRRIAA